MSSPVRALNLCESFELLLLLPSSLPGGSVGSDEVHWVVPSLNWVHGTDVLVPVPTLLQGKLPVELLNGYVQCPVHTEKKKPHVFVNLNKQEI